MPNGSSMAQPMRKGETIRRALAVEAAVAGASLMLGRRRRGLGLCAAAGGALAAWGAFSRNSSLYGSVLRTGPSSRAQFALTFDDGPGPSTPDVLDALGAAGAQATFFVLGRQVERYPEVVRRIVAEGHELANHGWDHGILVFRDPNYVRDQLVRTADAVRAAVGHDALSRMFRAPHGFRGPATAIGARRAGYRMAGWTTGVFDSAQPGSDVIAHRACRSLRPGGILLLHDADGWDPAASRMQTAAALGPICAGARERGLEPVSLGVLTAA